MVTGGAVLPFVPLDDTVGDGNEDDGDTGGDDECGADDETIGGEVLGTDGITFTLVGVGYAGAVVGNPYGLPGNVICLTSR